MNREPINFDWNKVEICNADGDDVPLTHQGEHLGEVFYPSPGYNLGLFSDVSEVACLTGNLENALVHLIKNTDFVLCCFAWLTNYRVLDAMAELPHGCQVVVQKEDFLRPDTGHTIRSNRTLRSKYETLRCGFFRGELPSIASSLSTFSDDGVEAVRCAGVSNKDRRIAAPRMHHKFAVFCDCVSSEHAFGGMREVRTSIVPRSVWTGSFNPTSNGTRSRENAVHIKSESAAKFFVEEWAKVFAVSEPLDWSSEWSQPEWRIGT